MTDKAARSLVKHMFGRAGACRVHGQRPQTTFEIGLRLPTTNDRRPTTAEGEFFTIGAGKTWGMAFAAAREHLARMAALERRVRLAMNQAESAYAAEYGHGRHIAAAVVRHEWKVLAAILGAGGKFPEESAVGHRPSAIRSEAAAAAGGA